jgi:NADH-quinone oxidoreductase subunit N
MSLSSADFIALLPLLVVALTALVVMLAIAVGRNHPLCAGLTAAGLALAFFTLWPAMAEAPRKVTELLLMDRYGVFYIGLLLAASLCVTLLAYGYLNRHEDHREEFYILLLLATLGAEVLVVSVHFFAFFLALELLSVSLYALIAYERTIERPVEAGIKYLILAASSAAFLLFGMALVYWETGTMAVPQIGAALGPPSAYSRIVIPAALALFVTGIGFKLAVVPFHLWTPDIYEGAPAPVSAWIATASKGSMFALLVRYFYSPGVEQWSSIHSVLSVVAFASMLVGNLLALLQQNVKRLLAYSSIAHLGYLLVAFEEYGRLGVEAATFYLVAYFATILAAFGVVTLLSGPARDADSIEDYRGLFWRRPVIALIFTISLLSLAGIPLTAGFIGKFYVLAAGASARIWVLVLTLVATSTIGLFYYLRVIVALYDTSSVRVPALEARDVPPATGAVLALLGGLIIWFGVYPQQLLELIRFAIPKFT